MKKGELTEIVKNLGLNNPEIEIYDNGDVLSVISHFNNGKYYNFYDAKSEDYKMAGPYDSLEEAQSFLFAKYTDALQIYKYEEKEDKQKADSFEWRLNFYLSDLIKEEHFEDAKDYFAEDNMVQYYDLKNRKRFKSIKYILTTCESGFIEIITDTDKLSKNMRNKFITWVNKFQDSSFNEGVENQYWAAVEYDWTEDYNDEELVSYDYISICNIDEDEDLEFIGEYKKDEIVVQN